MSFNQITEQLTNAINLKLTLFLLALFVFFSVGKLRPFRNIKVTKSRYLFNISLSVVNTLCIYAIYALLNTIEPLSQLVPRSSTESFSIIYIILSIILLDFVIYFQHRLFHIVPFFWKFHKLHHQDIQFDTTTALRFNPIEAIISLFTRLVVCMIFNINIETIIIFEVLLNISAMFNHSNFKLPNFIEKTLRLFIVTPSMHRIHHSVIINEANSNYGFFISLWDRIFKSYTKKSKLDFTHENTIGI